MKIWAHRGCSYAWPENTLQAFEAACKYPITGIEFDIQLTKDKRIVVIHDEKVNRTTDGSGYVRDFTLQELKELKIEMNSSVLGEEGYTQIPTIEETFMLLKPYCVRDGLLLNIELKNSVCRYEGMEELILEMVRKWELEKYIVYSSFNPESILCLKQKDPSVQTGILSAAVSDCLKFSQEHKVEALHPHIKKIDVADLSNKTDLPIRAWNIRKYEPFYPDKGEVEKQDLIELEQLGITDIFTNVPEAYLQSKE